MSVTTISQHRPVLALRSVQAENPASAMALRGWLVQSLLDALARDGCGTAAAAADTLRRALDLAEGEISGLLAEPETAPSASEAEPLLEPLTESETRVLRYLPTNLSKREIADELYVSVNTVKTHVKHLYAKLDVQTRRRAVERARELGLLSHTSRTALTPSLALVA
jgi:LuxR family maltose regulon positive regulatory protein